MHAAVDRGGGRITVKRVVVAHDCGLIINPDGLRNQIEGNVIQSMSRALKERVTWQGSRVTSVDWASYPILTFSEIPAVEIVLINRPEERGSRRPSRPHLPLRTRSSRRAASGCAACPSLPKR